MDYEVCVIGAGTAGYVAAIRAAQLGAKVLLVEKGDLGGVCLNRGCIPTKTLLKSAEKWQELQHCEEYGLFISEYAYDWEKVMERKNNVIYQLRSGVEKLLKANKVEVVDGSAHFVDQHSIHLVTDNPDHERTITADKIIIATGSKPAMPPIPGGDTTGVINSDEILRLGEVPESIIIIGAGAVGIEFAGIYANFGCAVTVVEMAPTVLPLSDSDLQKRMALALRKQYITTKTGAMVKGIKRGLEGLDVTLELKGKTEVISAEKVLVATGRVPVMATEELTKLGVDYTKRGITVNAQMETSVAGIYAIGDVTGLSMLAHSAAHQGLVAAENVCGGQRTMDYNAIPSCIFTSPEIAAVGLTEQECVAAGKEIVINKFNFAGNGKAITMGQTEGLVKFIADKNTHEIIGCHIMGAHASDLIMEGVVAVTNHLTAEELDRCIHPHPTLSEACGEALMGLFGNMVHQVNAKKA
ncbi:MAG: dihydrolipoyl dehydrogenase [Acidaminococcaceae bacterium]